MAAVPRFARATAASIARTSPKSSKIKDSTPTKFKRLSTQINSRCQGCHTRFIPVGLNPIAPLDPRKPCHLARLPAELRLIIFEYALLEGSKSLDLWYSRKLTWPALLHVSRVIRDEAAYVFYRQAAFSASTAGLYFGGIRSWVEQLPPKHRTYLSQNRNLRLNLWVRRSPPLAESNWAVCRRFGNMYMIKGKQHREHFTGFCRLAHWLLWCGTEGLSWSYDIVSPPPFWWTRNDLAYDRAACINVFMEEHLWSVTLPCVQHAWTRERRQTVMKKEALRMLNNLDLAFHTCDASTKAPYQNEWNRKVKILQKTLEKW